jgi:protocatechuate 3,4-dioxygenase beta subunit
MKSLATSTLSSDHASLAETLDVLQRRRMLKLLAGAGAASLFPLNSIACSLAPQETSGPYPADGTNGPNVLTESGILRSDIRSSFGASGSATATGTMNTIMLKIVSATSGTCGAVAGLAVYVWHCNATGGYSMYANGITGENYLRGVQITDANGEVTFSSIFPACYSGRWPHIHIEVYSSVAEATSGANAIMTTQLAMPQSACETVYAQTSLYPSSATNLTKVSLSSDLVFSGDDGAYELGTVSGNNADGWTTYLEVGVDAAATTTTDFAISPGITGSWYDTQQSGQGFNIEVLANSQIVVYFYTFDKLGNNVWLVGVGTIDGATAIVPLATTTGGFFPPAFDPTKITREEWGTLSLSFTDCNTGSAAWSVTGGSASGYTDGTLPITRITTISSLSCTS